MNEKLTVERAAIVFNGVTYSVPAPGRHHDVIRLICETTGAKYVDGEQGFLLSDGRFARRKPALRVAQEAGQIKDGAMGPTLGKLFSEDVW